MRRLCYLCLLLPLACASLAADPAQFLSRDALLYAELTHPGKLAARVLDKTAWRDRGVARAQWALTRETLRKLVGAHLQLNAGTIDGLIDRTTRLTVSISGRRQRDLPLRILALLDLPDTTGLAKELARRWKAHGWSKLNAGKQVIFRSELSSDWPLFLHLRPKQLVCATELQTLVDYIARTGPHPEALSALPQFKRTRQRYGKQAVWGFVNASGLLGLRASQLSRQARRIYDLIDAQFGLGKALHAGFGANQLSLMFPKGASALSLLRGGTFDPALLGFIPADSASYVYGTALHEPRQKWSQLEQLADKLAREGQAGSLQRLLSGLEKEFGVTAAELFAQLGPSLALSTPTLHNGRPAGLTLITQVKSRSAVLELLERAKRGAWARGKLPKRTQLTYKDAMIEHAPRLRGPGYALLENTLILTSDHRALKEMIDAQASGRSIVQRFKLSQKASAQHLLLLDPLQIARSTFGYGLLAKLAPDQTAWLLQADVQGDELRIRSSHPWSTIATILELCQHQHQRIQQLAMACEANLERIGQALRKHHRAHKRLPSGLAELKLEPALLRCPHKQTAYTYQPVKIAAKGLFWSGPMIAWCNNRIHGRIILNAGGYAYRASEQNFARLRARLKARLAEDG